MQSDRPHSQATPRRSRGRQGSGAGVPVDLRQRFARFRRANTARSRIPEDLRQAVLLAIRQGVAISALQRELGVTAKQVDVWRQSANGTALADAPSSTLERARVFELAERPDGDEHAGGQRGDAGEMLELRLGAWSVTVRLSHG